MIQFIRTKFILASLSVVLLAPGLTVATESEKSWERWFSQQIVTHPEVIAAQEYMNSTFSTAIGQGRPVYNPELDSEFERDGNVNNYSLGVSQTIDWSDKRSVRQLKTASIRVLARNQYSLTVQQKAADAIIAIVEWRSATLLAGLAAQQEEQMKTLLEIITERQTAGDIGSVDAELAVLGLSQRLNDTATAQALSKQAEFRLKEIFPDWSNQWKDIPPYLWRFESESSINQSANTHPSVVIAKAKWLASQKNSQLVQLEAKADPTFGIKAGKNGDENLVGLNFSIPLNVRNDFSAEVLAAHLETNAIESEYLATLRKQIFEIKSARSVLQEYKSRYKQWQILMKGRAEKSGDLLVKQWESGDLSTTEYMMALRQRAAGISAGIELQVKYQTTHVNWLLKIGQINAAVRLL